MVLRIATLRDDASRLTICDGLSPLGSVGWVPERLVSTTYAPVAKIVNRQAGNGPLGQLGSITLRYHVMTCAGSGAVIV